MNLKNLSSSQIINLSLAVFLFLGIAITSYTVANLTGFGAEARGKPNRGSNIYVVMTVSPDPIPANSQYALTFSNLLAGHGYNFSFCTNGVCNGSYWLSAGDTGTTTMTFTAGSAGTFSVLVRDVTCCKTAPIVGNTSFTVQ